MKTKDYENERQNQRSTLKRCLDLGRLQFLLVYFFLTAVPCFSQNTPRPSGFTNEIPEFKTYGEAASEEDSKAVMDLMRRFGQARGAGDAKIVASCFSEDVEWTNAFGVVVRGREKTS